MADIAKLATTLSTAIARKSADKASALTHRVRQSGSTLLQIAHESVTPLPRSEKYFHDNAGVPRSVRDAVQSYLKETQQFSAAIAAGGDGSSPAGAHANPLPLGGDGTPLNYPLVVLDLAAFRANAADMTARAGGTPIRVATKSLRIPEAIREAQSIDGFQGAMCYSLAEAIWLVREGFASNVLVAYPTADRTALAEWASDPALAAAITVTIDSIDHLDLIDHATPHRTQLPQPLRLCIDIDASLVIGPGMYIPGISSGNTDQLWDHRSVERSIRLGALRSPIHGVRDAQNIVKATWTREGLRVVGVLGYEALIAGVGDAGAKKALLRMVQTLSRGEIASRRAAIVDGVNFTLHAAGMPQLEFVNGGGTGSLESTSHDPSVTEIGAGSGLIGPGLFDGYRSFRPYPAEWFIVPVVRRPGKGVVTVAGGGRVASGAAGTSRLPSIDYPRGLRLTSTEGAGEVQTPLIGAAADNLSLGDPVYLRHAKAGEAAEWAHEVLVVDGHEVVDVWKTYRGYGKVFA